MTNSAAGASVRTLAMATLAICLALTAAQLALIPRIELTFDEAYYTLWSRGLAWGYLDHPPMIAGWIRASTDLFGSTEFGVRAFNALVFALMPALIAGIAWRLFASAGVAVLSALLWVSMPLTAGAVVVTPDAPLVVFWTLGLGALVEAWRGRGMAWPALGLALGMALQSKFTAAFFGFGVVLALATTPSMRRWFLSPWPYIAALLAALVVSPFVAWNATHGWATFAKQLARVPPHGLQLGFLAELIASQLGLANPLILLPAAAAIGANLRKFGKIEAGADEARRLLVATIAPAAGYFLLHALHDRVQGNWPAPLYPALAILAADAARRAGGWARATARWAPALGLTAIALVYLHVATAWPRLGAADPLARIGGWRELTLKVDAAARERRAAFLLTRGYAATSLLTYYGDSKLPVAQSEERSRWDFEPKIAENIFDAPGLALGEAGRGYEAELGERFRHVQEIARLSRSSLGGTTAEYILYSVADPIHPAPDAR